MTSYEDFDLGDRFAVVAEQARGRFIDLETINSFRERGISPLSLFQIWTGESDHVRLDQVVFLPRGGFEFSRYKPDYPATSVLTFVCWDAFEPLDICAWERTTGTTGTWLGHVALLGEDNLNAPRLDGGLHVHPNPLEWFRAKRSGVVIIDRRRAARRLCDTGTLIASSIDHARKLRKDLRIPLPQILVPKASAAA